MAARVELLRGAVAEAVAGLDRPAGVESAAPGPSGGAARIGFEDSGRPSAVALDLAIQAAGACAAPLPAGLGGAALDRALATRGCALLARFEPRAGEEPPPPAAVPAVSLPRREPSEREAPPPAAGWAAGTVLVAIGGTNGEPDAEGAWSVAPGSAAGASSAELRPAAVETAAAFEELSPTQLLAAADRFATRLAEARAAAGLASGRRRSARRRPGRPGRPGREILVLPRPLHDPAGRRLAAWALAAGAALALEPDREHLVASAVWVRPTVFAGGSDEIAAVREVLGERRRRGLPLRRLHTVAVLGGAGAEAALPEAERRFWAERGTAVTVV